MVLLSPLRPAAETKAFSPTIRVIRFLLFFILQTEFSARKYHQAQSSPFQASFCIWEHSSPESLTKHAPKQFCRRHASGDQDLLRASQTMGSISGTAASCSNARKACGSVFTGESTQRRRGRGRLSKGHAKGTVASAKTNEEGFASVNACNAFFSRVSRS